MILLMETDQCVITMTSTVAVVLISCKHKHSFDRYIFSTRPKGMIFYKTSEI